MTAILNQLQRRSVGGRSSIVRAIEVTQSIQSVDNDVRLIAGKPTVVRVYLEPAAMPSGVNLSGEMMWRHGQGGMSYLPSMNRVQFGSSAPSLADQRFELEKSLNFFLPPEALAVGRLELVLKRVFVPRGMEVSGVGPLALELDFEWVPPLRIRVIGLRYKRNGNPGIGVSPDAEHFAYMKSYLLRAYPIGAMEWSQIVLDADHLQPPFDENSSNLANAQLSAIRTQDIRGGIHRRTHYYGLVDNDKDAPGCTMRGSAILDRVANVFESVASGPAGRGNGWLGDNDDSFADWYSAHELGHTFQRRHPGFPARPANNGGQDRDALDLPGFPYPHGLISSPDNRYVGFDVGDPTLGLPMRVLRGDVHHDVMTYDNDQWVCKYTYDGIYEQLVEESNRDGI